MSVYGGIDVHRKRSQVAVIDAKGEALANRNVPNGVEPILKVIGGLPPGTPAAIRGRVRHGVAGGGCWRTTGSPRIRPSTITGRNPTLPAIAPASGEMSIGVAKKGSSRTPVDTGE